MAAEHSRYGSNQLRRRPWNYPYGTMIIPLIGAIASGCTCIVKPSEFNPAVAQLLADLFPKYLDQAAYRIVNGAAAKLPPSLSSGGTTFSSLGAAASADLLPLPPPRTSPPLTLELRPDGSYIGKSSFNTFVYRRSYINVPPAAEPFLQRRYPPYTEEAFQALWAPAFVGIPDH
ncbi:hypothetical protein B0H13DRAFT_2344612 [Mycena leptocephala]|nr:hypothetical protein B0H13DRAFT_2344612 [Mycena leptocephala]